MMNIQIIAILGIISGILSSIFRSNIIIGPGLFYLGGGELGLIIMTVIFLYFLYYGIISVKEIVVFMVSYLVANYVVSMLK